MRAIKMKDLSENQGFRLKEDSEKEYDFKGIYKSDDGIIAYLSFRSGSGGTTGYYRTNGEQIVFVV